MQIFNSQVLACLAAVMAVIPSTGAAPILPRNDSGKRIALWEWTNTRDAASSAELQASAKELATASKIFAVVNWGSSVPAEIPAGFRFQPMVHSLKDLSGDSWQKVVDLATNNHKKIVHTFNEPEMNNISPAQALDAWRSKLLPLRASTGAMLVSPAPSSSGEGTAWLKEFMSQLGPDEKPDLVGTHFYTLRESSAESEITNCKAFLEQRISDYGIPLAVSEIGSTSLDASSVETFTQGMAEYMDSNDMVFEYGFFGVSRQPADGFVSPAAQLLDTAGNWNSLGKWLLNN